MPPSRYLRLFSQAGSVCLLLFFAASRCAWAAGPTIVDIDNPATGATFLGTVTMSGWTYDMTNTIAAVGISIDGVSKGNATYGVSRPDVCNSGAHPGCPNVGWSLQVDTALLAGGAHTLTRHIKNI